jgi:phage baseplate assembly protein W
MNDSTSLERKDFLGRGWAMPVALEGRKGTVAWTEHEEDIRQSIRIILETSPGERVMRPNFGCGIHDLVFAALDSSIIHQVQSLVEESLRRCEARIEVIGVNVDEQAAFDGKLSIEIEYRVRKTNQTGNLVFPFYFKEGGRA